MRVQDVTRILIGSGKMSSSVSVKPIFHLATFFARREAKTTIRTNVASVGSVFNDTRKVRVLSLPETIKEKSTFRANALRRESLLKADFHSVQNVARSISSERFLLKCVKSTTANEIWSA